MAIVFTERGIRPDYETFWALTVQIARQFNLLKDPREEFRKIFEYVRENRGFLGATAAQYYKDRKFELFGNQIPLLVHTDWILDKLQPLSKARDIIVMAHALKDKLQTDRLLRPKNLPLSGTYIDNIIDVIYNGKADKAPYIDNPCYRLLKFEPREGDYKLIFSRCSYFDYINTCEYLLYDFARSLIKRLQSRKNIENELTKALKFKREADPFDFTNRCMVPGTNTLLVFLDCDEPLMWLHSRDDPTTVAEAVKTRHVVPAGTFQPIHVDDSYHEQDFSLFANILREFGEELYGDEEIVHPVGIRHSIYERPSILKYFRLIERGFGKVFYAGFGLDCLTLKPELLTIMVFVRKDFEAFFGRMDFKEHNKEGKPFAVPFKKDKLQYYFSDRKTLPAGAGCLYIAHQHFDELCNAIALNGNA